MAASDAGEDKTDGPSPCVGTNLNVHSDHKAKQPREFGEIPSLDLVRGEDNVSGHPHAPETTLGNNAGASSTDLFPPRHIVAQIEKMTLYEQCNKKDKEPFFKSKEQCLKRNLKIVDIDPRKFRRICNYLNIPRVLGGDWRSLAGELGYTVMDIKTFELGKNMTESLLHDWNSEDKNFALEILQILRKMHRDDVSDILEKAIDEKCMELRCNCEDCGSLS